MEDLLDIGGYLKPHDPEMGILNIYGWLCVIYTTLFTVSMSVGCNSVVELGALPL